MLKLLVLLLLQVLMLYCPPSAPPLTGSSEIATSHANQLSMFNLLFTQSFWILTEGKKSE
jgi:hypothetical protein